MTGSYANLGFDPAPGDPDEVASQAKTFDDSAHLLSDLLRQLTGSDPHAWQGKTADALRDHLHGDVAPLVRKTYDAFCTAADTYRSWASQLRTFQAHARTLENKAAAANDESRAASSALNAAGYPGGVSPPASDAQATSYHNRVSAAETDLIGILSQAQQLHTDYLSAASHHADRLQQADQKAPHKPSFISSAWHETKGLFTNDLPDTLAHIGNFCGYVAAACSIVAAADACIPGVDLSDIPLDGFGGVMSDLALFAHAGALIGGSKEVHVSDLGVDLLGIATMGAGEWVESGLKLRKIAPAAGEPGIKLSRLDKITVMVGDETTAKTIFLADKYEAFQTFTVGWTTDHLRDLNPANWFPSDEPKTKQEAAGSYFAAAAGVAA